MNIKLCSILLFLSISVSAQFTGRVPSYSISNIQFKSDTNTYDATRYWVMTMIGIGDTGRVSTTGGDKMYGTYQLWGKLDADSIRTRKIHAGGNLNYLKMDSVDALRLVGKTKVWKDVAISGFSIPTTADAPAFTTGFAGSSALGAFYYQGSARDDIAYFTIQINHDAAVNDSMDMHFHWSPTTTPGATDTVVWKFTYVGADVTSVFTPVSTTTIKVALNGKAQWEHLITNGVIIATGTGGMVSRVYNCSLQRLANSSLSDNYNQNAALLSIDAHAVTDRIGSNNRLGN